MKTTRLTQHNSSRLLIFFAGWGMDEKPFARLARTDNYDLVAAYDYGDGRGDDLDASAYDEVMIVAWSFGVIAADRFMAAHPELPFTAKIAINGTLHPADDRLGIPVALFQATLDNLSEASLAKFRRRMCGGAMACERFLASAPDRTLQSLRDELIYIGSLRAAGCKWDKAYISTADRIIPPENQKTAWEQAGVATVTIDAPHMPDIAAIVEECIVDKRRVARRFNEATSTYDDNATVQRAVAVELSKRWRELGWRCDIDTVIEIGAGTGLFTEAYSRWLKPADLRLWDLSDIPDRLPGTHVTCDAETAVIDLPPASVDAIASASTMQWFDSPRTFIDHCARAIKPGGWLVLSTFGPENFHELRQSAYPSLETIVRWVADDFELLWTYEETIVEHFRSPIELLRHIRRTGVNALPSKGNDVIAARRLIADGLCQLTYHPMAIVARRRQSRKTSHTATTSNAQANR